MGTALITGVNGQDGSYLAELLLLKGYTVFGMKRRSSSNNMWRLSGVINNPNFHIIEGDVTDYFSVDKTMYRAYNHVADQHYNTSFPKEKAPFLEVYNLAAQSHVHTSFEQPTYTFDVNYKGILNILEASRLYPHLCRIYQASTSEQFGDKYSEGVEEGVLLLSNPPKEKIIKYQNEQTPFSPMSPYAVAKTAAHYLVNNYRKAYGIHASCGILFNHEGPRRGEEFLTQKVCKYVANLKKWKEFKAVTYCGWVHSQKPLPLKLGNLDSYRDFGFAGDYVHAMWLMLQQDKPDDYVIATGETTQIKEFVKRAFAYIGEDWEKWVEHDESLKRPSEVDFLKGDASKANKILGWHRTMDLDTLIKTMVDSAYNG